MNQKIDPKDIRKGDSIRQEWLDIDGKPRASEWVIGGDPAYLSDHSSYTYYLLERPVPPIPSLPTTINSVVLLLGDTGNMTRGWVLTATDSWQSLHRIYSPCSGEILTTYIEAAIRNQNYPARKKYVIHDARDSK